MTLSEKGVALLIRQKKRSEGKPYTIEATTPSGRHTFTVVGWIGKKAFAVATQDGPRVVFSERDYLFAVADIVAAGLPKPAPDWVLWLDGEAERYKVSTPETGEPAVVFSDNERMIYRLHTKLWVSE